MRACVSFALELCLISSARVWVVCVCACGCGCMAIIVQCNVIQLVNMPLFWRLPKEVFANIFDGLVAPPTQEENPCVALRCVAWQTTNRPVIHTRYCRLRIMISKIICIDLYLMLMKCTWLVCQCVRMCANVGWDGMEIIGRYPPLVTTESTDFEAWLLCVLGLSGASELNPARQSEPRTVKDFLTQLFGAAVQYTVQVRIGGNGRWFELSRYDDDSTLYVRRNDCFTKTGSGQTHREENSRQNTFDSAGGGGESRRRAWC
eukprot:COSAG06_NODE_2695_length_6438_cov_8.469475_3_plen_261_part_00